MYTFDKFKSLSDVLTTIKYCIFCCYQADDGPLYQHVSTADPRPKGPRPGPEFHGVSLLSLSFKETECTAAPQLHLEFLHFGICMNRNGLSWRTRVGIVGNESRYGASEMSELAVEVKNPSTRRLWALNTWVGKAWESICTVTH